MYVKLWLHLCMIVNYNSYKNNITMYNTPIG